MKFIFFNKALFHIFITVFFLSNNAICNNNLLFKNTKPFIRFLSVTIDRSFKQNLLNFVKIDSIKYNSDKRKLELIFKRKKVNEIYFNGIVIMDNNFNYIFNSRTLTTIKHPSLYIYRARIIKSVIQYVNKRIKNSLPLCSYIFSKDYTNLSQYPKNSLRLVLNVFCYENSSINKFKKRINKLFHSFILEKKALSLIYMNKKLINKFRIRQIRTNNLNIKYQQLDYSLITINNSGIIISNKQKVKSVETTYNYDKIKNCKVRKFNPNPKFVCAYFNVSLSGVKKTRQIFCLDRKGYKDDLSLNYLSERISSNCSKLIDKQIRIVYFNRKPLKQIVLAFPLMDNHYLFKKIHIFIKEKYETSMKLKDKNKKTLMFRKILHFLHSSSNEFLLYLKQNSKDVKFLNVVLAIIRRRNTKIKKTIIKKNRKALLFAKYFRNALMFCKKKYLKGKAISFKSCFCYFYPFSILCQKSFCVKKINQFNYFCNQKYCNNNKLDKKNCICSIQPESHECKCFLHPLSRECFCKKFKNSVLCKKDFCQDNNNNHLFCICGRNALSKECLPEFCNKNLNDDRCKCLKNPYNRDCVCEVYSELNECKDQINKIKSQYLKCY